ncbi:MAG TPA: energy transducer TonB [Bryobacteraceae bacterium]|nr:energy transducer TonB [Bryobacteraceae bacterium]
MTAEVDTRTTDTGPDLLTHWEQAEESHRVLQASVGSLIAHVFLVAFFIFLFSLPGPKPIPFNEVTADLRRAVHLTAPPKELTQKEPNKGKVAKEVTVEELLATKAHVPTPPAPAAVRAFKAPPASPPPAPQPKTPVLLPEAPKILATAEPPSQLPPGMGPQQATPPPKPQAEPPKLAFETPGQGGTAPAQAPGMPKIATPKGTVDETVHSVARGAGGTGGLTVGDTDSIPSLRDELNEKPTPGVAKSSLELLSDPQGVDFKPYLIRILATVRRNWMSIIPESARLGRRGRVLLQFIVSKDGSVPKLVIAMPSGADALDRAAVAGVSASVPFPPLPAEFKGNEVRLQFAFTYNLK